MIRTGFASIGIAGVLALGLSACVPEESGGPEPLPVNEPLSPLEQQARAACQGAVRATTGNPDVTVIQSSFSEAGTEVIMRVGETGTWSCIGYRDGTTAGVTSLTGEGSL